MQERMKQMASNYDKQVDIGKSYFLKYDQEKLAVKFHLEMDERYLYLTYIGTPAASSGSPVRSMKRMGRHIQSAVPTRPS